MSDKKEVVEYLRNLQKAAEIEAQVNGINLWVLLGAMGVLAWQLIGEGLDRLIRSPEIALRILVASGAVVLFTWSIRRTNHIQDEVRISDEALADLEHPILWLLLGTTLLVPPLLLSLKFGPEIGATGLAAFAIVITLMSAAAVVAKLLGRRAGSSDLPKPSSVSPSPRSSLVMDLVALTVTVAVMFEQAGRIGEMLDQLPLETLKMGSLAGVLYILTVIAIKRRLYSDRLAWTYDLERDLILGRATADVALRRIEYRQLGPRLEDIMTRFFDDFDRRRQELSGLFDRYRDVVDEISGIPVEYQAERPARLEACSGPAEVLLEELRQQSSKFRKFLDQLEAKNSAPKRLALVQLLQRVRERHRECEEAVVRLGLKFKDMRGSQPVHPSSTGEGK